MGRGRGGGQLQAASQRLRGAAAAVRGAPVRAAWRLRWVGVGASGEWGIGLGARVTTSYIYVLDKWAGPKGYLGQNLCMVRVRVHPRVKF